MIFFSIFGPLGDRLQMWVNGFLVLGGGGDWKHARLYSDFGEVWRSLAKSRERDATLQY